MRTLLSSVALLACGCTPKVHLRVLEPSEIHVPAHVQQVAYVDRSEAQNLGQNVVGAIEGLLTGEEIGQDHAGRDAASENVRRILNESPRFEIVEPGQIAVSSSLYDEQMSWKAARKVCRAAGCQGIVALESFDSDSDVTTREEEYTEDVEGREVHKKQWHATRETHVRTSWRFYDVETKHVVDQVSEHDSHDSWEETASSETGAIESLPAPSERVREMGAQAGEHYGRRIAPSYVTVTRAVFIHGDEHLAAMKHHVKAGLWPEAEVAWIDIWNSDAHNKVKARAAHNIAVCKEIEGDLASAIEWARKSAVMWPRGRTGRYVHLLEERQRQAERLREQMSAPEAPFEEPGSPPEEPEAPAEDTESPRDSSPTIGPPPQ